MAVGALGRGVLAPVPDHERARGANRGVGRVGPDGELAASLIGSLSGIRTAWHRGVAATAGEEAAASAATVSPVVAVSAMSALTMILARGRFIRLASYDLDTIRYVLNTDRYSTHTVSFCLPDVCPGRGPASCGAGRLARGGDDAPGPAPSLAQDSRRRGWRSTGGHAALRTGCVQMPSLRC